ncbi:MAG: D-glycerate dehydrogenase [candidate division WOR-3 bacterium]|nr:D-glycerate dehydrogenase [candidate division WOR-3 bacterium]
MHHKPKVLLTRRLPASGMNLLSQHFDLNVNPLDEPMPHSRIAESISDKEGLACLLTDDIDLEIIQKASNLKIIANYAVGYNNIDLAAVNKRKIPVTNTPDVLTEATADLTIGLLISVARRIVEGDNYVRAGRFRGWAPELLLGSDVYGKTLGIVGMGRIGQAVARRAHGFGMAVLYYDKKRLPEDVEKRIDIQYREAIQLLSESDFVSIHAPLSDDTRHFISGAELNAMKRTAYLINVARGAIVDEEALVEALRNGDIAGCALDVYENEPVVTPELLQMPNAVLVPHIGSASLEARTKMALMVVENLVAVLIDNKRPPNVVNPEIYTNSLFRK